MIKHEHSGSTMFMNLKVNKDEVEIEYEHITGTEKFTEYFVKTFKTLLQKLNWLLYFCLFILLCLFLIFFIYLFILKV